MRKLSITLFLALSYASVASADISCTPTETLAQQNRTRMKHRTLPHTSPGVKLMTVADMVALTPAAGVNSPGFRTSALPIDPRETSVLTLKGDLWAINIEPNDCDFHLEISAVGGAATDDRVIAEIPQLPSFVAARNALINQLHAAGVALQKRTILKSPIRVQVLGFAFYDAWHYSAANPQRGNKHGSPQVGSLWEIHPVWGIIFPAS